MSDLKLEDDSANDSSLNTSDNTNSDQTQTHQRPYRTPGDSQPHTDTLTATHNTPVLVTDVTNVDTKENSDFKYIETLFISKNELDRALHGFSSILPPVFFTMVLSAATVLYVTPDAQDTFEDSSLLLYNENNAGSSPEAAGQGLVNALIIIGVITCMTFLIVLLLYFKCEWLFAIYLFVALVMLMGFTTAVMVLEGLQYYLVPTDIFTLGFFFYNYAIVGAIAIFSYEVGFQGEERIIPYSLAQFYLVIISVVMAWLVTTLFPDFTLWALLVCLALYDLCAVLTPCGPLNLLIKVVTKRTEQAERAAAQRAREQGTSGAGGPTGGGRQKQMIPGLLYEVNTGPPKRRGKTNGKIGRKGSTGTDEKNVEDISSRVTTNVPKSKRPPSRKNNADGAGAAGVFGFIVGLMVKSDEKEGENVAGATKAEPESIHLLDVSDSNVGASIPRETIDDERRQPLLDGAEEEAEIERRKLLQDELIARKVRERNRRQLEEEAEEDSGDSNLKLGLGDFVFYSVLTAKAAEFGFIAFISVACCVLCGLCGTLVLLSVFQKALPALPISIALGVVTYIVAFKFVSPFSDDLALNMISV